VMIRTAPSRHKRHPNRRRNMMIVVPSSHRDSSGTFSFVFTFCTTFFPILRTMSTSFPPPVAMSAVLEALVHVVSARPPYARSPVALCPARIDVPTLRCRRLAKSMQGGFKEQGRAHTTTAAHKLASHRRSTSHQTAHTPNAARLRNLWK
jgi:hypothetical protein